jgi:hypothetical protein
VPFFLLRQNGLKLWDATGSRWVVECSDNETEFKLLKYYPTGLLRFQDSPHCVAIILGNIEVGIVNSYNSRERTTDGIMHTNEEGG